MAEAEHRTDSAETVKRRARVIVLQGLVAGVLILFIVTSLVLLGVNAVQGAKTRSTLLDCVEPSGKCFKEGQARTGDVVAVINQISVYAASCAAKHQREIVGLSEEEATDVVQECVDERIKEEAQKQGGNK